MKKLKAKITGVSALLCHSGKLADPLYEGTKQLKKLSSKRGKTDADLEMMAKVEFIHSLYLDNGQPCIPAEVLEASFINAARRNKQGKKVQAGVVVPNNYPLIYDGPRDPEKMWEDGRFRFSSTVRVGTSRVSRMRPRFNEWAADIEVEYDPNMLNEAEIKEIVKIAGESIGIGDWRPRFGRFKVEFSG